MTVNTLNFCAFAQCSSKTVDVLIAVPGVPDGCINVISLPEERRVATIPSPKNIQAGLVMALGVHLLDGKLVILAGYESGHTIVWQENGRLAQWQAIQTHKVHTQPVLSLGIAAQLDCFFTSSADALIGKHEGLGIEIATKTVQTKHAGQQSLRVRSDSKIFATAGWDGRIRVYSSKSIKELATLKWHKEGCYALDFASLDSGKDVSEKDTGTVNSSMPSNQMTVSQQRTLKAKSTHWLAAGSKDGKISLWDIY
jgi:ASTRA-associated protein 1